MTPELIVYRAIVYAFLAAVGFILVASALLLGVDQAARSVKRHPAGLRRRPVPTRAAPLERRTPLRRTGRLRARSKKTAAYYRTVRVPLVERMLAESPWCELGPVIAEVAHGDDWPCTLTATGLHELRKRNDQGSLENRANLRRACNPCNGWVEDNPLAARALGLVVRRGDPGWEALGR